MGRLVFILPEVQGGVKTYNINLALYLERGFIDYKLITYSLTPLFFHAKQRRSKHLIELSLSKYARPASQYKYIRSEIETDDILVCNDSFELEAINHLHLPNKIIYVLHGDLNHYNNILRENVNVIDQVICVSNGLKEKYERKFPDLKFDVSHPFVKPSNRKRKEKPAIPECIFIGRFEYLKGADLFLDLMTSFEDDVNWTIITTSSGSEPDLLNHIPATAKIFKDISNEKVLETLAEMDVLIFPSRTEGFGIAILEAMMHGVIPIVLDIPIGIPDQVIDGYNGFLVKPESWNQDAPAHLKKLFENSTLRSEMKKNAIEFAREKFDPKTIAGKFLNQVDKVQIRKEKFFNNRKNGFLENVLPELVYRVLKMINNRMKHGS